MKIFKIRDPLSFWSGQWHSKVQSQNNVYKIRILLIAVKYAYSHILFRRTCGMRTLSLLR